MSDGVHDYEPEDFESFKQTTEETINSFVPEQRELLRNAYAAVFDQYKSGYKYAVHNLHNAVTHEMGLSELGVNGLLSQTRGNYRMSPKGLARVENLLTRPGF